MKKPWTESHGPIAATELEVRRAAAINELLMAPLGLLPRIAGDQIKPFALGLFDEIKRLSRPDVSTQMVEAGAVALGEAGGGQTLGGGAQDYRFIPEAILSATGVLIRPAEARTLKEAVVG